MKIIAFGASNSKHSINQTFASWAAHQLNGDVHLLDLNDFEMPLFSVDREQENGIPEEAEEFLSIIGTADVLVISMAEHNGSYTVAFKNILDWCSRSEANVFQEKPVFLLATSPGAMGGRFVLETALSRFPRHSAKVLAHFSLPKFAEHFDNGIKDEELNLAFKTALNTFQEAL